MFFVININALLLLGLIAFIVFYCLFLLPNKLDRSLNKIHGDLKDEIRDSIRIRFLKVSIDLNRLCDLAIDVWRLRRRFEKLNTSIPENMDKGLSHSFQKIGKYLQENDIEIRDFTNQKYNDGLNIDVLSVEKNSQRETPFIRETVEPSILHKGQIIRRAKVIIERSN